jgi:AcrR family transcriptional regulator
VTLSEAPVRGAKRPRKDVILDAAAELFAERGYEATTLMDLAVQVGIAKATLFHYFTTKEMILFELYTRAMDMALQRLTSVEKSTDRVAALHAMLREHALVIMTNQSLYRIFFGEENSLDAEHLKHIRGQQAEYINLVAEQIQSLQRAKKVLKSVHPRVAAQSMLGVGSWTYRWFEPAGELSAVEIADFAAGLAVSGILR